MSDERAVLLQALDEVRRLPGVEYAELRFVEDADERLTVRDGRPEAIEAREGRGVGVRVLADGQWGFACVAGAEQGAVARAARAAWEVARASARAGGERVKLAAMESPARGRYATAVERDPFAVPLGEKLAALAAATTALRAASPRVFRAEARMGWTRLRKLLVTSNGVDVEQAFTFGGAGMSCVARGDDGEVQRRSFPSFHDGGAGQGGYERFTKLDLVGNAPRVADEAAALLTAPPVPAGRTTVILESSQLALQVHESCGHPAELDRALGTEISLAGGSFLQPEHLGRFRYGSPRVNLVADATCAGGLGTFGWDDEGVPAARNDLVREGVFVGYLSSRETAAKLGVKSSGSVRAESYARIPLIRMVNVNLEPDPAGPTLEELLADTPDGLLIATNKSWSIDDVRLNFQFGCEAAWEIKNGRRTRLLRNPVYTGVTPQFWGGCDAVCGPSEWQLWGILNCGKGEPTQIMQVGHGAAPARFRDVEVGHG